MSPDSPGQSIRSVDRAIDLLSALEMALHPMGVSDLGRAVNVPRATALRVLGVLVRRGLVEKVQGRYQIGVAAVPLAHAFLMTNSLSRAALPVMQELADVSEETVSLFVRLGFSRVAVQRVEGLRPLRYTLPIGQRLPLHVGIGKVLAAGMPEDELTRLLDHVGPIRLVTGEIRTREALLAELAGIREQGFAVSISERNMGITSVAAVVPDLEGDTSAAIAVIGPSERVGEEKIRQLSIEVRRAAQSISARYRRP